MSSPDVKDPSENKSVSGFILMVFILHAGYFANRISRHLPEYAPCSGKIFNSASPKKESTAFSDPRHPRVFRTIFSANLRY
jgi:hypothetical protein